MDADALSVDTLLREHAGFVERLARRLLDDPASAEDVSQQTWQVVLEKRPRGVADPRAWLAGVVRNLARLHERRERARIRREARAAAAQSCAPGDPVARLDEVERLVAALRRLREPFRTTVLLRYREDLAPRAIAQRTGVPVETVKSRLKRGLAMLRDDLRRSRGGDDREWWRGMALLVALRPPRRWAATLAAGFAAALLTIATLVVSRRPLGPSAPARSAPAVSGPVRTAFARHSDGTAVVRTPLRGAPELGWSTQSILVVDAASGAPLPDFVVRAPDLDPPLLATDGQGLLHFSARPGASIELRVIDDPRLRLERAFEAAWVDGVLHVNAGPTYRIRVLPSPLHSDRFDARLVAVDPRRQERSSFAPVRLGAETWVRFGPDASDLDGGPPWRLELRSDDGHRFGAAEVRAVRGTYPEVVTVELGGTGVARGVVVEPDGRPIDQAEVVLDGDGLRFASVTDRDGRFEMPWIPPGGYRLRATSRLHASAETRIELQAGDTSESMLQLAPAVDAGTIAGRLVAIGGRSSSAAARPVTVVLTHASDPDLTFVQAVACADAPPDGVLASFAFRGLPRGEYELSVRAPDFRRWSPPSLLVTAGEASVELRRLDAEPVSTLVLRATDTATGARLDRFDAFVRLDRDDHSAKVLSAEDGELHLADVPLSATLEYVIRAPGHVPARGDRSTIAGGASLDPGWGNTLRCVDREGRAVAGVAIELDGVLAGTTDATGTLHLVRPTRPERIAVGRGAWSTAGGDVYADGRFADLIWGITVVVSRGAGGPVSDDEQRR